MHLNGKIWLVESNVCPPVSQLYHEIPVGSSKVELGLKSEPHFQRPGYVHIYSHRSTGRRVEDVGPQDCVGETEALDSGTSV